MLAAHEAVFELQAWRVADRNRFWFTGKRPAHSQRYSTGLWLEKVSAMGFTLMVAQASPLRDACVALVPAAIDPLQHKLAAHVAM